MGLLGPLLVPVYASKNSRRVCEHRPLPRVVLTGCPASKKCKRRALPNGSASSCWGRALGCLFGSPSACSHDPFCTCTFTSHSLSLEHPILITQSAYIMAPRGLSAEEKRVRLLEIFHETKDFFQLKELEKLGPKMKGIVSQSVKEVLQSLVDDGLVQADKIGSSNFFWSFPSQRGAMVSSPLRLSCHSIHNTFLFIRCRID
ncbi:uncharacterized protein PHACADRAFT_146090 [Phanerochaete carnosa HHB-10118-sp]|uniref:Mnd1 HTH domain-containing protein n=1 Tax=Phanerochaete carnosa (strain HHB-10118-sp) TaxID=650164 RepID=K5W5Q0_PHACS|nr:uncharacterized protein PHACADRAFT_146090 [Phanerochaete carnosa HHB-10118-sp]EKM54279.1 hypothetical protein PHACADRAFT_146090 [Phanerochaete carnosa HHB-10118-sp]